MSFAFRYRATGQRTTAARLTHCGRSRCERLIGRGEEIVLVEKQKRNGDGWKTFDRYWCHPEDLDKVWSTYGVCVDCGAAKVLLADGDGPKCLRCEDG